MLLKRINRTLTVRFPYTERYFLNKYKKQYGTYSAGDNLLYMLNNELHGISIDKSTNIYVVSYNFKNETNGYSIYGDDKLYYLNDEFNK